MISPGSATYKRTCYVHTQYLSEKKITAFKRIAVLLNFFSDNTFSVRAPPRTEKQTTEVPPLWVLRQGFQTERRSHETRENSYWRTSVCLSAVWPWFHTEEFVGCSCSCAYEIRWVFIGPLPFMYITFPLIWLQVKLHCERCFILKSYWPVRVIVIMKYISNECILIGQVYSRLNPQQTSKNSKWRKSVCLLVIWAWLQS